MPKVIQTQANKPTAQKPKPTTSEKVVINLKSNYTPKQAAEAIGCTRQMVMVYINRELIKATQEDHQFSPTGKGWVISGKELNRFIKEYTPAPELGGAKKGVKRNLPRPITERKNHPLTILQRKLNRAMTCVETFREELKEMFPKKEANCRDAYAKTVAALNEYLAVTTPTSPHVQVVTKEV